MSWFESQFLRMCLVWKIWLRGESSLFCKQHLAMKYLLVVSLLQQASAGTTTGAPSPSIPQAGGASVTITGSMTCGFGNCTNAQKCTQTCTNAVMNTLKTQKNLPSTPTGTPSYPGCSGGRRLSESDQELVDRIIASATVRRLAQGDVNFAYSFTATANQQDALISALSPANMNGGTFLQALKTSLAAAVPGIDTSIMTAPVFVAPTANPSTTPSQVSAAVGSQATLPAVALLLACIW